MKKTSTLLAVVAAGSGLSLIGSTGVVEAATDKVMAVFISNDTEHPVPTRAIGTTAVAGTVDISNGDVNAVPVRSVGAPAPVLTQQIFKQRIVAGQGSALGHWFEVSAFETVRLSASPSSECTPANPGKVIVSATGVGAIDGFDLYYPGGSEFYPAGRINKVYDTPGTEMTIFLLGPVGCFADFVAWGRP